MTFRQKELLIIVLAIAVLALILVLGKKPREESESESPVETNKPVNKIEESVPGTALAGFPAETELPMPQSATVVRQYRATAPDGRVQATRMLTSPKNLPENFDYYKNLLKNSAYGWTVLNEVNSAQDPNHRALFAQSTEGILNINLDYDSVGKKTNIDLSFLLK